MSGCAAHRRPPPPALCMAHDTCAVVRPGQFKVNLTSLLDCLNVFSHSLVRDNPLEIEYSRGEAMQLRCAPCCSRGTQERGSEALLSGAACAAQAYRG